MTLIGPDLTKFLLMKEFPRRLKAILQSFKLLMRTEMFFFFFLRRITRVYGTRP